jgi:hypothetical protein
MCTRPTQTFHKDDLILRIYQDKCCESPRQQDNSGVMVLWHMKYNLGDNHDFDSLDEFKAFIRNNKIPLILPVYMYEHSRILFSLRNYKDEWDSGQVGFIYMHAKEYNAYKDKTEAIKCLEAELQAYTQYINGEVYGYQLIKVNTCNVCGYTHEELIDSYWGFFGSEWQTNGLFFYAGWS